MVRVLAISAGTLIIYMCSPEQYLGARLHWTLTSTYRRFENWIMNGGEREIAAPRFSAYIMVRQFHVERVLGGPSAEEHDTFASGWVDLVSRYREEGHVSVGSTYLIPRAWSLLQSVGWSAIDVGDEEVFCN